MKEEKEKREKGLPPQKKRMTCTFDKEALFTAAAASRRGKVAFTHIHTSEMPSLTTVSLCPTGEPSRGCSGQGCREKGTLPAPDVSSRAEASRQGANYSILEASNTWLEEQVDCSDASPANLLALDLVATQKSFDMKQGAKLTSSGRSRCSA